MSLSVEMLPLDTLDELKTGLQTVTANVNRASEDYRGLKEYSTQYDLLLMDCERKETEINSMPARSTQWGQVTNERRELRTEIADMKMKLHDLVKQVNISQSILVNRLKENVDHLWKLHSLVVNFNDWKREQQLSGNGVPMQGNTIQELCNNLASLICDSRVQLTDIATSLNSLNKPELEQPYFWNALNVISESVTSLLFTLGYIYVGDQTNRPLSITNAATMITFKRLLHSH